MKQGTIDMKLVDVCGIQYGCPFDASLFSTSPSEGMPLIRIRDVKGGQTETYYSGEYSPEFIIRKGDYLIGMDGEFNIAPWQSEDALLNQRVCKIYTKSQDVVIRYVYRFLQKELKKIEDETPFVTVKHLSAKRLNQVYLPVPPIAEQEKIVAELDCLSGIIEKKKQQLKELDNLAQSIFYEMFGDPVENDKGWEVKKLGEVCDVRDGTHDSPKYLEHSEYVLVTSKNITSDGDIDFTTANYISKEDYDAINKRSYVDFGDIIMAMIGTIGKPIIVKETSRKFCIKNVALIKFEESTSVTNTYIQALLSNNSYASYIQGNNKGGTQKFIALGTIRKLLTPIPPLTLQQDFASKIESIEKQKELIAQSIKETETLFNSRMDYYFN